MGDHRNNSEDSRVGGQVPQSKVIGQAFVRVWPITQWRGFGVPKTFSPAEGRRGRATVGLAYCRCGGDGATGVELPVLPGPLGREAE